MLDDRIARKPLLFLTFALGIGNHLWRFLETAKGGVLALGMRLAAKLVHRLVFYTKDKTM